MGLCLLIPILFFSLTGFAAPKQVTVAFYEMAPHMYSDKTEYLGAVPEFLNKNIFAQTEWKIKWKPYQFSRVLKDLEMGRVDMAVLLVKNEERQKLFNFSELPLYQSQSAIVVKKESKLTKLANLDPLKGLHLVHNLGMVVPAYFNPLGINFEYVSGEKSFDRGLRILRSGRVDGFFVPLMSEAVYHLQKKDEFRILQIPRPAFDLYIAFRKGLSADLIAKVNAEMKAHRVEYQTLLSRYYQPEKVTITTNVSVGN